MIKRLHTRVKIFFPNPYVVRLDHDDKSGDQELVSFMKLTTRERQLIYGTWGFSRPEYEVVNSNDPGYKYMCRSYWCFKDEMDALQFKLITEGNAVRVYMWPKKLFTIHEVVEADE